MNQHQRSNEQVRRGNLVRVLSALHYDGPQSRAELTRLTGFYRSTIAALVAELIDVGLASEALPEERLGVGRPSPIVAINTHIVGIVVYPDVDAIIVAVIGLGGVVHKRVRRSMQVGHTPEQTIDVIAEVVTDLHAEFPGPYRFIGLGAAVPALVEAPTRTVTLAPNLGWSEVPFGEMLEARFDTPVVVANDAQLGAIAERQFGPGRGVNHMLYLNGSAGGIGGGAYVHGHAVRGYRGYGAEFGHIVIDPAGPPCFCGQRGCLERFVNRGELLKTMGTPSLDADEFERALIDNQDADLAREIDRQIDWLGDGIATLISSFAPQLIVLGGFLSSLFEARPERLRQRIAQRSFHQLAAHVELVRGGLGSHEVLVGAGERIFETVLTNPAGFGENRAR
ncbi:putative NBD/HSP70 family sugar kinase [Leucobacter exalbidus]|uniref:NBD/HSP70 family sugar kinase n=1 Tax=Leucobacter exalbidus TaxID=662960 RepID=A0A940PV80_9MICO|nr:ROK family protein [Leucobacter exalbidus]MBP1325836.1 putative NBD/HSP70 family sugar kinase [Leucobacter exalbidus]